MSEIKSYHINTEDNLSRDVNVDEVITIGTAAHIHSMMSSMSNKDEDL